MSNKLKIYRASAGSGKTYTLAKEYIEKLFAKSDHRAHRRILAVTFTNKATDEMKSRIMEELFNLSVGAKSDYREDLMKQNSLSEEQTNAKARKILLDILHDYSGFNISTIDKFFQQIIRSFAREIGVSGGYNIELNSDNILEQAVDNLYMSLSDPKNVTLFNWIQQFMKEKVREGSSWNVKREFLKLGKEIFKEEYQQKLNDAEESQKILRDKDRLNKFRSKLRKIKTDFEELVGSMAQETIRRLEREGLQPGYFFKSYMYGFLNNFVNKNYEIRKTFYDFAESSDKCYAKSQSADIKAAIDTAYASWLGEALDNLIYTIEAGLPDYSTADQILKQFNTLGILSDLAGEIKEITDEQNLMLISDTNLLLNKIIDNSDTPFVYERTGLNIDNYMIDEFQDTSTLQWANFKPLVDNSLGEGHGNMVVGDVKQSIYRWRSSDWELLGKKLSLEYSPEQLDEKGLGTNWRSDRSIIEFNNLFFKSAANILQKNLNSGDARDKDEMINEAYSDIQQEPSPNSGKGYVRVEFIEKEEGMEVWKNEVMERIPPLLEQIKERGYKASDVAFLVRKNDEAALLTRYLLEYSSGDSEAGSSGYELVGREGLELSISRSVNFIVAALKLALNPADEISRLMLQREYLAGRQKMSDGEAVVNAVIRGDDLQSPTSPLFTDKENESMEAISRLPLFEACENLIQSFELESWYKETVFLLAFQDVIFKFSNSHSADLNSFLQWWDEHCDKQRVHIPENDKAYKVMTVHSAKGLDFKVVIVPFANWAMKASGSKAPLLWCKPTTAPFNELPLLPLKAIKTMENTIFREEYLDEMLHQYVDNLNVAYVAFTRARNEMHIFTEKPKPKKQSSSKADSLPALLYEIISNEEIFLADFDAETSVYESGEASLWKEDKKEESETGTRRMERYPSADSSSRLKIRHASSDFWEESSVTGNKVNYGLLMHDIMQQTIRRGDEERAIEQLLNEGKIDESDAEHIRSEMQKFWELPEVADWFDEDAEILNETAILMPGGGKYRPDRVIIRGKSAKVIDYKFGEEEQNRYIRQLERYSAILSDMGYDVSARLYYVTLGKVVDI